MSRSGWVDFQQISVILFYKSRLLYICPVGRQLFLLRYFFLLDIFPFFSSPSPSSWTSFKFKSICNVYSDLFICSSRFGWFDFHPYLNEIVRNMRKWILSGNKIPLRGKRVAEAGAGLAAPRLLRLLVRLEESGEGNDFIFPPLSFFPGFWYSWRILLLEGEGKVSYFHGFLVQLLVRLEELGEGKVFPSFFLVWLLV